MAARRRKGPSRLQETLTFWVLVLIVSAAAGFGSYRVGRDWLGKRMAGVEMSNGASRIVAQSRVDPDETARTEAEARAPAKAVVTVEDREPTRQERLKAEGKAPEDLEAEPQDGADVNHAEAERARKREAKAAEDEKAGDGDRPKREKRPEATSSTDEKKPKAAAPSDEDQPKAKPKKTPDSGESSHASSGGREKYVVTAGSYADADNASKAMARLSAKGYSPYIETIERHGKKLRRVNVAVVRGRDKANDLRDELAGSGVDASVSSSDSH